MKISIVTISYNQGQFLERAIRSVIEQDYDGIEYIIVDAGSTDGSREIIEKYRDHIAHIIFEPDEGPADGLNKGFKYASGEIFAFLNADDTFLPGALHTVAKFFMVNPDIDLVMGNGYKINEKDEVICPIYVTPFTKKLYVYRAVTIVQQATFFRREAYQLNDGFNPSNYTCWDGELFLQMARNGFKFACMNKFLANFRIHTHSISGSGKLEKEYLQDYKRLFKEVMNREENIFDYFLHGYYRLWKWIIVPQAIITKLVPNGDKLKKLL